MEFGIGWMVGVAQAVAALPGAVGRMPAFGTGPLIIASLGIIVLGLLRTRLRWSGALLLVLAGAWAISLAQPDVLVASDGANVAVRGADGRLRVLRAAKDSYQVREWLAADADSRSANDSSLQDGVSCDADGCVAAAGGGALVALSLTPAALADDCAQAAVIVTSRSPPGDCAALAITLDALRQSGALALRQSGNRFIVDAQANAAARPWSPQPVDAPRMRAQAPNIDATPAETDRQGDE